MTTKTPAAAAAQHPDPATEASASGTAALVAHLPDAATPAAEPPSYADLLAENQQLKQQLEQARQHSEHALRKYRNSQELRPYQAELIRMQQCLESDGRKAIIVFEGRGASGKGGTIRRITQYMNAKRYKVVAFGKPREEQRTQWFYQKYIQEFPHAGEILLFDRSWYSRALIEPVFSYCSDEEYANFLAGVKGFEKDLRRQGIILIKLYFSVSKEEQARRYAQRRIDPLQSWKLEEADLDAEEFREAFTQAKYRMLRHTHSHHSPWTIIRSDDKHKARLNAIKVILSQVDYAPLDPELSLTPDASCVVSGARELERMEAYRIRNHIR
ncbi:MAG: polyphosphate kinase 2 [Gammaproteobacteria bacterium]|nr:polyphosphate kinase 2 [Gammaproteobacteria bacterium]